MGGHNELDIAGFYDWLAPEYDRMTDFDRRFERELPVFRQLVERHAIRSAVDAGSGTGFHALLLAKLGVRVTAVDLSPEMLSALEERAASMGLEVRTVVSGFDQLAGKVDEPADAVLCLGNSLPHLRSAEELQASLEGLAAVLRPGGVLFTQTLNYDRILSTKDRIQNIKEAGGTTFIRFYDFEGAMVRFNILRLVRSEGGIRHELRSVDLRPVMHGELLGLLKRTGFTRVEARADLQGGEFRPETSKDLVVAAVRG
jgi:SAM-dependent methyltransferase